MSRELGGDQAADAGELIAGLVEAELSEEWARKESLERRGVAVITTSGALVTLVLTVGRIDHTKLREASQVALICALVAFVAAAAGGLVANLPQGYKHVSSKSIASLLESNVYFARRSHVERKVALARAAELRSARLANARKARAIYGGLGAELVATVLITIATAVALLR